VTVSDASHPPAADDGDQQAAGPPEDPSGMVPPRIGPVTPPEGGGSGPGAQGAGRHGARPRHAGRHRGNVEPLPGEGSGGSAPGPPDSAYRNLEATLRKVEEQLFGDPDPGPAEHWATPPQPPPQPRPRSRPEGGGLLDDGANAGLPADLEASLRNLEAGTDPPPPAHPGPEGASGSQGTPAARSDSGQPGTRSGPGIEPDTLPPGGPPPPAFGPDGTPGA
jgi:hypothetical protein